MIYLLPKNLFNVMKFKEILPCFKNNGLWDVPNQSESKKKIPKTGSLFLQFVTAINGNYVAISMILVIV